jgi:hypothetical protein
MFYFHTWTILPKNLDAVSEEYGEKLHHDIKEIERIARPLKLKHDGRLLLESKKRRGYKTVEKVVLKRCFKKNENVHHKDILERLHNIRS